MQISNWLWSWLELRQQRRAPQSPLDYAARLSVRKLEERQVLNVAAVFNATTGALSVTADAADHVTVSVDTTTHEVTVNGNAVTIEDSVTHNATSVLASDLHAVNVTADGNFDNVIDLSGLTSADPTWGALSVHVDAGGGNDHIIAGSVGDMTIDGGAGTDVIDVNSSIALTGTDSIFLTADTINIGGVTISTDQGSMTFDGALHLSSSNLVGDIHLNGDMFADSGINTLQGDFADFTNIVIGSGANLDVTGLSTGSLELGSGQSLSGSGTLDGNLSGTGTVSAGSSPGILTINGDFTFAGTINFEVDGTGHTAGVDYDQLVVSGDLDLTGATLNFTGNASSVSANELVTLILNNGSTTTGEAASHTQGQSIDINGTAYKLFYSGGDGNDVVLVEATIPNVVYVEDLDWSLYTDGTLIANADGFGHSAIFGVTAFSSIQSAIDNVAAGGTVEINAGNYSEAVVVDKSLTLDGLTGAAADVQISGSFSDAIAITSGATDVTVSDLTVTGSQNGISAANVSGNLVFDNVVAANNNGDGFNLQAIGSVQFVDVTSQDNLGNGIWIQSVTGLVDVNNATLTGNGGDGFNLTLAGSATLTNVDAESNGGTGLTIATILGDLSLDSITAGTVSNGNGSDGVSITEVYGTLSLTDVTADGNTGYGIWLVQVGINSGIATITGGGAGSNGQDGLHVALIDHLTVTNGTYSSNSNDGLNINNVTTLDLDGVTADTNVQYGLEIADTGTVNVSGGSYSSNDQLGIFVFSADEVHLTNVDASDNLSGGVWIVDGGAAITVDGGTFNRNLATHGLVLAADDVTVTGATADDNEAYGIVVIGASTATITDTEASGNGYAGLIATSVGAMELDNLTVKNNELGGVVVSEADSVTIAGGTLSDNTGGVGISIDGVSGAVSLTDVTVTGNSAGGLSVLVNTALAIPSAADTVHITGGDYSGNTGFGVQLDGITTSIEIDSATVQDNVGYGIQVSNAPLLTLSDLTMTGNSSGSSIANVTTVTLNTTTGADVLDINTTAIGGEGHLQQTSNAIAQDVVAYSGVAALNVNTLDGNDVVNVAAHSTTAINLDGGADTDTISIETPNPTLGVSGSGFTVATAGNALISAQNFENANLSGAVVFSGSTGDDTLTLTASDANTATYTLETDGNLIVSGSIASVTSVEFDGGAGDDLFVIQNPVAGLFNPANGIVFDGGTGGEGTPGFNPTGDSLQITGGSATTIEHQVGNANSDGAVLYNGSTSITYTSVASILDTVDAANRTFTFLGGAETITVSDTGVGGLTNISSTAGMQITFSNPTALLSIDSGDGDDTIEVDGVGSGFVASLNIDGGTGNDVVDFNTALVLGSLSQTGSITVQAETINVNNGASLSANGGTSSGTITLTASEAISLNGTGSVTAGDVALVTDSLNLDAASSVTGTTVEIHQFTSGVAIDLGSLLDPNGGPLSLSNVELGRITATTLTIGDTDSGSITVSDSVAPGNVTTLHLVTGSAVIDANAAGADITVTNLAIEAVAGIGDGNSLDTVVSHLAFHNTTSGNVSISNTGSLTIDAVAGVMTSSNDVAAGTVTLVAASPITYAVNVTSGGTITATTADNGLANTDNITVNAGVTVESAGGDVVFQAGDRVVINGTATVKADVGNVTLVSGFNDSDGDGGQQLDGLVQAGTTVTIDLSNVSGSATQSATGSIIAPNLELISATNGGSFALTSASNNVTTLAGNVDGAVQYRDVDGLNVGTVSTTGLVTTNDNVTLLAGGAIGINESIAVGTGTVRIAAGGTVSEASGATITAASLGVTTSIGDISLDQNNSIGTFAASNTASGGVVTLIDTTGVTIDSISADGGLFAATSGISTSTGDVTISAGGVVTLDQSIAASGATVRISAAGSVTETGATVTADSLSVRTTAEDILLTEANNVATFAANNANSTGAVKFENANGFEVGSVVSNAYVATTTGITTTNGDVTLKSNGAISISESINAGTAIVRLAAGGSVTEAAGKTVTASRLGVTTTAGDIQLDQNNNVGTFAASNTAAGGAVILVDSSAVSIGSVAADGSLFAVTNGISTSAGDVTVSAAGAVTLNQSIAAAGATVRVSAAGDVTEAATATITATALSVRTTAGDILLTEANDVATFAASNTAAGKTVKFQDANGFNIGSVASNAYVVTTTGIATSNANVTLKAGGAVGINESINAGNGTVRIAAGGSVTESTGKTITADSLGVTTTAGNVLLTESNQINTLAVNNSGAAGVGRVVVAGGVTIGTVASDSTLFAATTGVTTSNGDFTLAAAGAIAINQAIAVGTGTVRLQTSTGGVTQSATGTITADKLGVRNGSTGSITLDQNNNVAIFAANNSAANATVMYHNTNSVGVGAVAADGTLFTATNGIGTNVGDVTITSGGAVTLDQSIAATGAIVRISAASGIAENAGAIITASSLGVQTTSGDILLAEANDVATFAASNTGAANVVRFQDANAFNVGAVASNAYVTTTTGITTSNGDATLKAGGALGINESISVGSGTARLAAGGNVTEASGKTITASVLGVTTSTGSITLDQNNTIGTFSGGNAASGGSITFVDSTGVSIGSVTADGSLFSVTNGITTSAGDVTISAAGTVTLNQSISAAGATVRVSAAGNITEATGATITASALGVRTTSGNIALTEANDVTTFAASDAAAGQSVKFRDANAFNVGSVSGTTFFTATTGVTTSNGDVTLKAGTTLGINESINAGNATVRISAGGNITEATGKTITAASLGVTTTAGSIVLTESNQISTLAASDTGASGAVQVVATGGVTVGSIAADTDPTMFSATSGITTSNGNFTLAAGGLIQVNQAVNVGSGTVRLNASTGGIAQSAAGVITADHLGVRNAASGNITLDQNNVVGTFAANNSASGGTVTFVDSMGLIAGTVSTDGSLFSQTNGISTSTGDVTLSVAGTLALNQSIAANGATVRILAAGDVTEASLATVTAASLGVRTTAGNIILTQSNDVTTFAANNSAAGNVVKFQDANAVNIGSVSGSTFFTATTGISTSNGNATLKAGGAIGINEAISVGSGTVRIAAGGNVTEASGKTITANSVGVTTTAGNITLDQNNTFGTFAATNTSSAGSVTLVDTMGVSIGSVSADGTLFSLTNGITTSTGDVTVSAAGTVTLNQSIAAAGATVRIGATGAVTEATSATITAASLSVRTTTGDILLTQANDVTTFAASNTSAGNAIKFQDANSFNVGAVVANTYVATTTGVASSNGDLTLKAGGSLNINESINAGSGAVRIAAGGSVSEASGKTVTAASLGVTTSSGNITLDQNNSVGTFAAGNSSIGGSVTFVDATGVLIGSVTADGTLFSLTNGISTSTGDVTLSAAGAVTLNQSVSAAGATVRISAAGSVTEAAAATVTAAALGVRTTSGTIVMTEANDVGTFAATNSSAGQTVKFRDANVFNIGSVSGNAFFTTTTGVATSNGDVTLKAGTTLGINESVNAGTATVRITAGGNITEATGKTITANTLGVITSAGNVVLTESNQINTLAVNDSGSAGLVQIVTAAGITIGSVTADTDPTLFAITNGVTTTNGAFTLSSAGTIQINQAVSAGSGTVRLQTTTGGISQSATGTITADTLGVRNATAGNITLDQSNNVSTFAASNTAANASITYNDVNAVTIGSVTAGGSLFAATNGISTSTGNVNLSTGGLLTIGDGTGQDITAAGATVTLTTSAGGITEAAGSIISANNLLLLGTGNDSLTEANLVNTLAANVDGSITYVDANALTIGSVGATNGITTSNDNVSVKSTTGDLTLIQAISAGTGTVALEATAGSLIDGADGSTMITAGDLSLTAKTNIGDITNWSTGTGNAIDATISGNLTKASVTDANGEIFIKFTGNATLGTGALSLAPGAAASAIIAASGNLDARNINSASALSAGDQLALESGGTLTIPDAGLNVGDTGNLRLHGTTDVVDASGRTLGQLRASNLDFASGSAGGSTVLDTRIATINAVISGASASGKSLTINEFDGLTLTNIATTDGAITVNALQGAGGNITVLNVNSGTARATLVTTANGGGQIIDGDTVDNPATPNITAAEVDLRAATGIGNANKLEVATSNLAATTVSGDISVRDVSGDLAIANLASGTNGVSITGGVAGNKIEISTVGALTVNAGVTNNGTGNRSILLASDGTTGSNDLAINANVTTTGGNSSITLLAGDTASFAATSTVSAAGTGSVQVLAGTAYNNGAGNSRGTTTGNVSMSDGSVIQSDDGNITLSAPNDVVLSIVNANANGDANRGVIVITADADLSGVGAISEGLTGEAANLTGSSATLTAATGIGAADDIDTNLDSASAVNSTSGAIAIQEVAAGGALTLTAATNVGSSISVATINGQLTSAGVVSTTGAGTINLFAGDSASDNNGNLVLQAAISAQSGQVTLTSEHNDVTFNAAADVTTTTGTIQVNAGTATGGKIVMTDNSDNVNLTVINAGSGLIDLNAGGDITISKLITTSSSTTAVQIHSTSGAVIDADSNGAVDIDAVNGRVVIVAATGIGSANAIETSVASIDITNTTSGNVSIVETDALSIQRINQQGTGIVNVTTNGATSVASGGSGISATTGKVTLLANGTSSDIDVDATISTTSGACDITAGGNLTVNQAIGTGAGSGGAVSVTNAMVNAALSAGQGDITLNGGGQDVIITADQSKAVTITYSATRDIIIRASVTATGSTSDIILTADSDGNGVGGVWIDESAATNAKLDAGRDVILKGSDVFATAGSTDSIRIDGDGAANQILAGRSISLTANAAAPVGADIIIDGVQTASTGSITVDSKDAILISANQNAGTDILFQDAVQLTNDVTLAAAQNVTFVQSLDGNHALQINAGGVTAFEGAVGATNALTSLTTDAAGTTDLNGGVINVTTLDLQDDVILTANTVVNATTATFEKTINADLAANNRTLLVNATTTTFNGAIGTTNVLANLTTDAFGATHLNAGTINATVVDFQDAVILESTTIVNATTVSFDSTLDAASVGGQGLTVNASGTTTFGDGTGDDNVGGVTSLAFLTTDATGSTVLKSTSVTTTGDQTYHDAVVLASNTVATNTTLTGVNVSFDNTVDGAVAGTQGLTINASGVTTFGDGAGNDNVGGTASLSFLTTDSAGITVLKSSNVTTSGDQTYHDAVVLASNNLSSNTTLTGTNISFYSTVDGTTAATQGLTVNASGVTTFGDGTGNDNVGGVTSLSFLTTDAAGSTVLKSSSVTTSGDQTYHDAVVLASNSITANTTLTGINISFDSTLDGIAAGTQGLTVNASGVTTFGDGTGNDAVGGAASLSFLTTDTAGSTVLKSTSVTTSGDQTYRDAVVLASNSVTANTTLTGVNVSFASTLDGTAAGTQGLTLNASGVTTFGDGIGDDKVGGATSLSFLTTDGAGSTLINSTSVTTSGNQTYNDAVVLASNSVTAMTTLTGADITFASNLNGTAAGIQSLTLNATGDILFTGAVGGVTQLGDTVIVTARNVTESSGLNATSLVQQAGTGTTTLDGNVATTNATGVQLTTSAITVNAPITTTGSGVVTFTNAGLLTINGNINSDGAITQNGVGAVTITEPRTITTTGDSVSFAKNVTLNGSGALLTIDTTTGGNSAGANVSFLGTVHGATSGVNSESLTINAGTGGAIRFAGQVDSLQTLTITNSDTTTFQSGLQAGTVSIVDTTDTVAFQGNTTLGALATTNQPYNMTFGKVGGPAVTDVITNQVTFLNTGLVTIGLNAGDNVTFTSGVTHTVSPTSVTGTLTAISSAVQLGTTSLNGTIRTQAQQVSLQATTLVGTSQIDTTFGNAIGANIQFGSTLNATAAGIQNLTLNAGTSGDILFTGAVGGGTRLGSLAITNAHNVTEQAGITSTSLVQSAGTGTTTLNAAVNTNSVTGVALTTNAITINDSITSTGNGGVTLTNAGLLTLNGNIISDGAVIQNGAGAVTVSVAGTRSITTTGDAVSFLRAVTLNGSAGTFSVNTTAGGNVAGGNVTFSNTVNATTAAPNAEKLQITAGTSGDVLLNGAVGGVTRLGDVLIASARNVTENGGIRSASLTQSTGAGLTTLGGAVDTSAAAGVQLTTGAINVNNTVSAINQITMTTLNTNGNINLNSTLTTTQPGGMVSLTATRGGIANGAAANVVNVVSDSLVMQTTQGIGSAGSTLLTQVSTLAAHNTGTGNIRVDNVGGQLLTIGTIGGVKGVVNDGAGLGNIAVTNAGSITVSSFSSPTNGPVSNSTGGSISLITKGGAFDITVNSPITASGGSGNIILNAGRNVVVNDTGVTNDISAAGNGTVYLTAANSVVLGSQNPNTTPDAVQHTVPNDVVIQSGTGSITNTLPLVYNVQAPQLGADGVLTISGDFGRPGEHNFTVTIYWGDGTSSTQTFANAGHFSFSHAYTRNPNQGDQSAPILINVQVAHDPHVVLTAPNVNTNAQSVPDTAVPSPPPVPTPNINADLSSAIYNSQDPNYGALHSPNTKIVSAPGNVDNPGTVVFQDISILATAVPVPGEGLATFPYDVTPPVVYLHFPEQTAAIDVVGQVPLQLAQQDTLRLELISADEGIATDRQVILEIIRADGSLERIRLDENVLDDLMKTVSDLPDGRYRFLLLEPGESRYRTLMDLFEVRQGKIVDENDTGDRPPSSSVRPVKPATTDAPADAEEAIRNAHANESASLELPETEFPAVSDVLAEAPLMDGWKSMSARRAWKQAERLTEAMSEFSLGAGGSTPNEENSFEASAVEGQHAHASIGAVAAIGIVGTGLVGSRTGKNIVEDVTARFGRAARLFRKLGSKPK